MLNELIRKALDEVFTVKTWKFIVFSVVFFILSGLLVHFLEPETFKTPFIGFYYVMDIVSVVGFGKYKAETVAVIWFTIFLYLFGVAMFGIIVVKVVNVYSRAEKMKGEGKVRFYGLNHVVIINWSGRAKFTIGQLLSNEPKKQVVLIDSLPQAPMDHSQVHYIQGNPTDPEALLMANILQARTICIFAPDQIVDDMQIDGKTVLIASAIQNLATSYHKEKPYIITEIVSERHIQLFENMNVNEYIVSNEPFSNLMTRSALQRDSYQFLKSLLQQHQGVDIWKIKKKADWKTYNDAYEFLKKRGANLLSSENDFTIMNQLNNEIPSDATLYILCSKKSFDEISQSSG